MHKARNLCEVICVASRGDGQLVAEAQEAFVHRVPAHVGELGKLASEAHIKQCSVPYIRFVKHGHVPLLHRSGAKCCLYGMWNT